MTIAVKIESPVGTTLQTRNFQPGQEVRVGGQLKGFAGIGEAWTTVRMELTGDGFYPLFAETTTNFFGDFWFDIQMPSSVGKAELKFIATFVVLGQDEVIVPIAIGNVMPDKMPTPESGKLPPLPPLLPPLPALPALPLPDRWTLIGIASLVIFGIILMRKK